MAVYMTAELPAAAQIKEKGFPIYFGENESAKKILVFNLMITVEQTEKDLIEKLVLSDVDTQLTFMRTESWTYRRASLEHYEKYYKTFSDIENLYYDGIIISGAPLIPGEDNAYWEEYRKICLWSDTHTKTQLHICWAGFAAVMQKYNAELVWYDEKYFGVFGSKILVNNEPILDCIDDGFLSYASREVGFDTDYVLDQESKGLKTLAVYNGIGGPALMREKDRPVFYTLCHFDYDAYRLQYEYHRDIGNNIDRQIPENYFVNDIIDGGIKKGALINSFFIFGNWLKYYVD